MKPENDKNAKAENERLPRAPRKLTHFFAQEALYDYVSGRLDLEHKRALEAQLQDDAELRNELKLILEAEKYTAHLAKTRVAPVFLDQLQELRPATEMFFYKLRWKNWPDFMKWSAEAFLISIFIAATVIILPWDKIQLPRAVREIKREAKQEAKQEAAPAESPVPELRPTAVVNPAPAPPDIQSPAPAVPTAKPTAKPTDTLAGSPIVDEGTTTVASAGTTAVAIRSRDKMRGLLYRILIDSQSAEALTPEIKDKIISLGGKKAGEVELGWRKRNPNGNYFHFTMPESNYQQFITTLDGYGPVRIFKNPHERVMPEGQIRIILWIEDKTQEEMGPTDNR